MVNGTIKHHGIKGMRWGVRRTPEQLGTKSKKGTSDSAEKKRGVSEMSDDDLRQKITRMRSEEEYKKLSAQQNPDSKVKRMVQDALENFGKQLLTQASTNLAQRVAGDLFKSKPKSFDVSAFEFKDLSKTSTKQLQEAVQWYSLNEKYQTAKAAYEKKK